MRRTSTRLMIAALSTSLALSGMPGIALAATEGNAAEQVSELTEAPAAQADASETAFDVTVPAGDELLSTQQGAQDDSAIDMSEPASDQAIEAEVVGQAASSANATDATTGATSGATGSATSADGSSATTDDSKQATDSANVADATKADGKGQEQDKAAPESPAAPKVEEVISAKSETKGIWQRLYGANAYGTMQAVVRADGVFVEQGGTVIVASGEGYWDALAASGLAGLTKSPIIITPGGELCAEAKTEIARLAPKRILVMGGDSTITDQCLNQIRELCPEGTERISGRFAPDTAIAIFRAGQGWSKTAVVAASNGYWDSLSISSFAYARHAPIFLAMDAATDEGRLLSDATLEAIKSGGFARVIIVGGDSSVSSGVEGQLAAAGYGADRVGRLYGKTALDTSATIAEWEVKSEGMNIEHLSVASSGGYWDALTGSALSGVNESVLALVSPEGDYRALDAALIAGGNKLVGGYVYGGDSSVSVEAFDRIARSWSLSSFSSADEILRVGLTTRLTTMVVGMTDGLKFSYDWKRSDGSDAGSAQGGADFDFTPANTGVYTLTVSVSDAQGGVQSKSLDLLVWGNGGTAGDLIAVAREDIGYYDENDPETGSKFGRWYEAFVDRNPNNWDYGEDGVAYCAMAVSYWCDKAGITASGLPRAGCEEIFFASLKDGTAVDKTRLEPGMIVLFDWDDDGLPDHVGIVEKKLDDNTYQTIEGNTSRGIAGSQDNGGWVARRERKLDVIVSGVRPYFT